MHGVKEQEPRKVRMTQASEQNGHKSDDISSIHARIVIFEHPFAYQVLNPKTELFCSYCMRAPVKGEKLLKCAACDFVRYCSKDCQRLAWKVHRPECRRLQAVFPNLPLTEVLFLSKIIDRLIFLAENGDKYGWERERKFWSLVDHKDDIREDPIKMQHFEKLYKKMEIFRKDEMIDKEAFFDVFCKTSINSHSIHTNAGTEVGMALDLGISKYNHSCRPTCTMVFDGYRVCLRPLVPGVDASDVSQAFISYIDVGRSKYVRRKDLKARWYFDCECSRCVDPADDMLTAIKCSTPGCPEPLITSETAEPCYIACPKCRGMTDDTRVIEAQELMKSLPASFSPTCPAETLKELLAKAEKILHPHNVYITRLRTALFHVTGSLEQNMGMMHKQIYDNYKLCFPKADRHLGYQILHIVKDLIEKGEREEAISYAFEAMNIFEVCFGLDHPYYLQTLALWTYLDKHSEKTDDELIALTHFSDNRPVDIVKLLAKANMLPSSEELQQSNG
uniref:MYND-type domain-containing protein n=1 Tax=Haemonchus contortus TaxID=6289 RepID=A0A7I4XY45_HAECO|nr:Zinc finger domain containing protein [Haemonchus contortus]